MSGYVGQIYAEKYPRKIKGFISVDSAPLQRQYLTSAELWLVKRMEPVYRHFPWKLLKKLGTEGVAVSVYGRRLMRKMMMTYEIPCPAMLICGEEDHAGSCIRYNKAWHKKTGLPFHWIKGAGHNSNTDKPEIVNHLIEDFVKHQVCHKEPSETTEKVKII